MTLEKRREEEKERVLRYVQEHSKEIDDDIANALNMHLLDVQVALHALANEGKVVEATEEMPD